jgi:hypothetical protein
VTVTAPLRLHIFFSVLEPFFTKLVLQLRDHGVVGEVSGTIWGPQSIPHIADLDIPARRLIVLSEIFRALPHDVDYEYLRSYEDPASGITAPLLVTADRVIRDFEYERGMAHIEASLRAVEAAFDRDPPDILLMGDVACIPSFAHYLVAKRRGVRTIILGLSRLPNRLMTYSNPYALFEATEREYGQIRTRGLSDAERGKTADYLAALASSSEAPSYMTYMGRKPAVTGGDLMVIRDLWRAARADAGNYTVVRPGAAVRNRLTRILRTKLYARHWTKPVQGDQYVLFPLHYQPEASTSVRAPFFMDQCALAENIARALPAGYRLYVKEHSAGLGRRGYSELLRLRRIPSVRLIDPFLPTQPLIQGAACVATITGTMGWEALVHGIPVVTFGRVFYEACASVHRAAAPEGYPELFRHALSAPPQRRDVEDFTAALLRTSFPGRCAHPLYLPDVLADDNIQAIAGHVAGMFGDARKAIA